MSRVIIPHMITANIPLFSVVLLELRFVRHTSKDNPMTDPGLVGAVGQAVGDFCSDFFLRALVYLLSFQVNLFGFTDSAIVTEMLYGGKIIDCLVVPLICSVVKGRCLLLRLMDRFC